MKVLTHLVAPSGVHFASGYVLLTNCTASCFDKYKHTRHGRPHGDGTMAWNVTDREDCSLRDKVHRIERPISRGRKNGIKFLIYV